MAKQSGGFGSAIGRLVGEISGNSGGAVGKRKLPVPPGTVPETPVHRGGVCLCDLRPGQCGVVAELTCGSSARLRLLEMGLTPGTRLEVVRTAAFGGPIEIRVRGYQLTMRRDDARCVVLADAP